METIIKVKELANILGISESTVKKYYLLFEDRGYRFMRSTQGKVMFSDYDISLFQKLIKKKNEPGMTVQKTIDLLLREFGLNDSTNKGYQNEPWVDKITNLNQKLKMEENMKRMEEKYDLLIESLKDNQDIKVKRSDIGSRRLTVEF